MRKITIDVDDAKFLCGGMKMKAGPYKIRLLMVDTINNKVTGRLTFLSWIKFVFSTQESRSKDKRIRRLHPLYMKGSWNPFFLWQRMLMKIEFFLYHKVGKVPEGCVLPRWAIIVRHILHPGFVFERFRRCRRDMSRDIMYIYGVPLSGQFLYMHSTSFKNYTIAVYRDGLWHFCNGNPGDWLQINDDGWLSIHGKHIPVEMIPLPKWGGDMLKLIARIQQSVTTPNA